MRILIHGINFSPELTGIGKYSGEMAEWLAARGHEVRVVTAQPYYPQWRIADGYKNGWSRSNGGKQIRRPMADAGEASSKGCGESQGCSLVVFRCPLWIPAKPSGLTRVLHLASFALSSFPVIMSQIFWQPELVLVIEPPLFCAPQAWLLARLTGGKACLHIQDYEVDAAFNLGLLKGVALRSLVAVGERWLMRRFDRVLTISQRMADRALAKGVEPGRVVLFPNWVDFEGLRFGESELKNPGLCEAGLGGYRAELGIAAGAVVALYSGNMGGKQGLEILAQAARIQAQDTRPQDCNGLPTEYKTINHLFLNEGEGCAVPVAEATTATLSCKGKEKAGLESCALKLEPDVVFVFCGNGAGRVELVALCDGLPNVRFMDLQPLERLGELLAMADIHLLPQRADAADLVMPSKLTGMLASGRPVVATAHEETDLANMVAGCGLVVQPEQPQAFADAINMLAQDAALRARLGAAGRAYAAANLEMDAVLGSFEAELRKVLRTED